jgi:hypothetical protein
LSTDVGFRRFDVARMSQTTTIADAGTDLTVERAIRHSPDGLAEGLDDLPEGGKPAKPGSGDGKSMGLCP